MKALLQIILTPIWAVLTLVVILCSAAAIHAGWAWISGSLKEMWTFFYTYPWFSIPFGLFCIWAAVEVFKDEAKKKAAKEAAEHEAAAKECDPQPSK